MSNMIADTDTIMIAFISGYCYCGYICDWLLYTAGTDTIMIAIASGHCTDTNMIIIVSEISYGAISYHNTRNVISYHKGTWGLLRIGEGLCSMGKIPMLCNPVG